MRARQSSMFPCTSMAWMFPPKVVYWRSSWRFELLRGNSTNTFTDDNGAMALAIAPAVLPHEATMMLSGSGPVPICLSKDAIKRAPISLNVKVGPPNSSRTYMSLSMRLNGISKLIVRSTISLRACAGMSSLKKCVARTYAISEAVIP